MLVTLTAQKIKFSIKDLVRFLKKSLMKNFVFCAVTRVLNVCLVINMPVEIIRGICRNIYEVNIEE